MNSNIVQKVCEHCEWIEVNYSDSAGNNSTTMQCRFCGKLLPTPAPVADNPDHIFNPVAELPKDADGKETIKDYLENRIKGLYEADAAFCKDRWDMNLGPNERGLAREMSNQVTFARQELQEALKHL